MSQIVDNVKTEISKIQDAENETRNVQAQFIEAEDLQTVEQVQLAGFESNPPVGTKHLVKDLGGGWKQSHAENDGVAPDAALNPGETKVYSSSGGAVKARLVLKDDGKCSLGDGTNEVIDLFDQLLTEMKKLVGATLLAGSVDAPGAASTGTLSVITGALGTMETDIGAIQTALGNLKI